MKESSRQAKLNKSRTRSSRRTGRLRRCWCRRSRKTKSRSWEIWTSPRNTLLSCRRKKWKDCTQILIIKTMRGRSYELLLVYKSSGIMKFDLELWCSWLSRLLYTQKVLGSNPSSSTFLSHHSANHCYYVRIKECNNLVLYHTIRSIS